MEMISCARCGKLFNYIAGPRICQVCNKAVEEKFKEVKTYVRENPNVDMKTLSRACEVSPKQIGIPCERCGKTIKSGRFCDSCKNGMTRDLEDAAGIKKPVQQERKKKAPDSDKMRFLG